MICTWFNMEWELQPNTSMKDLTFASKPEVLEVRYKVDAVSTLHLSKERINSRCRCNILTLHLATTPKDETTSQWQAELRITQNDETINVNKQPLLVQITWIGLSNCNCGTYFFETLLHWVASILYPGIDAAHLHRHSYMCVQNPYSSRLDMPLSVKEVHSSKECKLCISACVITTRWCWFSASTR